MIDFLSQPATTDLAYSWVRAVFPDSASEPYGQAFAVFTSSLTFLAALFMGWHVIIGIVTSAYSGKVLGERYHQIWAPLRVVLGFGLLVPIAGGFSTVHYLLRDVVGVAAVQMANAPIVTYINGMATNPPGLSPAAMQGGTVAQQILALQACGATVRGVNEVVGIWISPAHAEYVPSMEPWSDPTGEGYKWSYGDCGAMFLKDPKPEGEFADANQGKIKTFALKRATATNQLMQDLAGTGSNGVINYEEFGKYFATKSFDETMGAKHAEELKRAGVIPAGFLNKVKIASDKWNDTVAEAAKEVFSDSSTTMRANLVKRIEKYGFMVAGSYERTLSQMSAMAADFAGGQPTSVMGSPGYRYNDAYLGGQGAIVAARQLDARTAGMGEGSGVASTDDGSSGMAFASSVLSPLMGVSEIKTEDPSASRLSGDPVGDMISRGHWFLAGAETGIAVMTVASGYSKASSSGLIGSIPFLSAGAGVFEYLSSWIGYAIMISMIVGIMHAFILPMIPMIMVFVMGVSWLVLFLEAAIAGVLWAFAFVRMDGNEFFDRNQAPGITLLFNLFLRPAIGMLAFIGGLILMPYLLNGLGLIWDDSFYKQTGNFGYNYASRLVQFLIGILLYCWMQWHLYLRVWGLVPTIADRVGHWMGFQMHGYNDGQESHAAAQAMIGAGLAATRAPIVPGGGAGGRGGGGRGGNAPTPDPTAAVKPSKTAARNLSGNAIDPGKGRRTSK